MDEPGTRRILRNDHDPFPRKLLLEGVQMNVAATHEPSECCIEAVDVLRVLSNKPENLGQWVSHDASEHLSSRRDFASAVRSTEEYDSLGGIKNVGIVTWVSLRDDQSVFDQDTPEAMRDKDDWS
jgi:hypothetical protein